ncbi:hypothetical protein TAO_1422 [Candidatus Nitrosoglobus terrae]|uniref:Uncharacterized protein n=1 Tax=Candidatus Nitrosoglobus terrae TaxID=1630141 RepID=A0A1Q2SNT8_9GAMM|nr:hypothetical protein TAO_1422 [Candidatus Nitrosoglobus terrae]
MYLNKLKNWTLWVLKDITTIDASNIVRKVTNKLKDKEQIASKELQQELINALLDIPEPDYEHNLAAGRLYSSLISKNST